MSELVSNVAFRYYVLCAAALAFNPIVLAGMTAANRGKHKSPATPEDEKLSGNPYHEDMAPEVARLIRAHRNALENIPITLIVGLIYVLVEGPAKVVLGLMATNVLFRWLHSVFYIKAIQPWRTASFGVGALCTAAMIVHSVVLVAQAF